MTSNKPYFIRALFDWIVDNDLTPYLLVDAMHPDVEVPLEFVNGGRIILNIDPKACRGLHLNNDRIVFTAKFSGQTTQISLSPGAVLAVYAKENGRGMEFDVEYETVPPKKTSPPTTQAKAKVKPFLKLVSDNDKPSDPDDK
ncbi:MAG: ClpXP protease specificity-enhancing factor [Legionellaceae bacterium]|nr:ClpXP protease specificity-enhancing factor [Legionellaceae bacterium]MBP9776168.1 ClpXP protease specificity-enhancing factor [Legionellaceae bacterium]